jgi:hypothetical protein
MRVEEKSTFVTRLAGHSPSPENCGLTLAHLDFSRARLHFAKFHHSRDGMKCNRGTHTRICGRRWDNGRPA